MRVKSYFHSSVAAAMAEARAELGPEALFLNCREAPPEARELGAFEVTFAAGPETAEAKASPAPPASGEDPLALLTCEVAALRQQMQSARVAAASWYSHSPLREQVLEALEEAGIEGPVAGEILDAVEQAARSGRRAVAMDEPRSRQRGPAALDEESLHELLAAELGRRLAVAPSEEPSGVVALIGPAGSGKTSMLVKLAVHRGLAARRAVHLISADGCRIGAARQLQSFAAILGVGCTVAETPQALQLAVAQRRKDGLVMIDTPAYGPGLQEEAREMAACLAAISDLETGLVLPATMKAEDLDAAIARFRAFQPSRLLFTRLDETCSCGALFSAAARSGLALSFVSAGPLIPEDLEAADRERLVAQVLRGRTARARSVA